MKFLKKATKSQLFKFTSLNSLHVLIKIGVGIVSAKFLAIFLGPSGMAITANFRNFISSFETLATLGLQNGIVKYVAENKSNHKELEKIISTLFFTLLASSVVLGTLLFLFTDFWNAWVFGENHNFSYLFKILAIFLPFYLSSLYINSMINGLGNFKRLIYLNIAGNILGLLTTLILVINYNIYGGLLSMIVAPTLMFLASFYFLKEELNILDFINFNSFKFQFIKDLSHYFLMGLVASFLGSLTILQIRNYLISQTSIEVAGYWEAMSRISSYYLLFINALLTMYYYPKLVKAETADQTRDVFLDFYKKIVPFFGLGLIVLFFTKDIFINILLSKNFLPVSKLFFWQLIGDFLKVISWILGLQFFAKKRTKEFIITEVISLSILYLSSIYCIQHFEGQGVVMAHAFTYFLYSVMLMYFFRKTLFR